MSGGRLAAAMFVLAFVVHSTPLRAQPQLLWGDMHLHTSNSFDAFLNGNHSADPETAYRYAKGLPVIHPYNRTRVRIDTPLDFLVVADHAEFYGGIKDIYLDGIQEEDPGPLRRLAYWYNERQIREAIDSGAGPAYFADLLPVSGDPVAAAKNWSEDNRSSTPPGADLSARNTWQRMLEVAEAHNEPGRFTALIGWEWSSVPAGANLHRVIVTDANADVASTFLPLSSVESPYPADLWRWLEQTSRRAKVRFVAIPHNPNISKGLMFGTSTLRGEPVDVEYASARSRWEPVAEVTQIKGDSETHPSLSPDDPFADFELYPWHIQQDPTRDYQALPGDYMRSGLRNGLALAHTLGINPYQFGVIGSTDSHTGLASAEESNFWGKMAFDSVPENKQARTLADGPTGWTMQAGGLAAVWAADNSRGAIIDALQRREVYATTGPRIQLRFFAGYDFGPADMSAVLLAERGYARGVAMGGLLSAAPDGIAPTLLLTALKDPKSANLDRLQIIKGWVDHQGQTHERVFDVAASGDRQLDETGRYRAVGDTVNRADATWTDNIGAAELNASWQDPTFDPTIPAFYYVRVLQIPTPRHALYDAIALGLKAPTEGPSIIQERAYSSPIWYRPEANESGGARAPDGTE